MKMILIILFQIVTWQSGLHLNKTDTISKWLGVYANFEDLELTDKWLLAYPEIQPSTTWHGCEGLELVKYYKYEWK